ncbi:N-6 DNA methylase [Streptomyces sp. NPDC005791]|uniref:N-6 DNA methylase n=1 Tax=Streptomyces sp. NPDC005791 TaxID=3364732 RepID=UPI0036922286
MSTADHSDQLHSQAEIASLAGVSRATITQWRRAPGFPSSEGGGGSELFRRADVLAWLDARPIPRRLLQGDPEGTTFGARARRSRVRSTPPAADAPRPETPETQPDPRTADHVRELMGQLCDRVRGAGSRVDYVNLLVSLHFLRRSGGDHWNDIVQMSATGKGSDGSTALLKHIAAAVDEKLRLLGMRPAMHEALVRLEPRTYGDLRHVVRLVGELGPEAFVLMLDEYELLAGLDSGEFFTPRAVARVMVLIAEENRAADAPMGIYDPYARGGELLAAATAWSAQQGTAPRRMRVRGLTHGRDTAPLATMNLTLLGARPSVRVSSGAPPWTASGAFSAEQFDLVLSNPPFNMSDSTGEPRAEGGWPYGSPPQGNDNLAYVQHVLSTLREGGAAAVIMPNKAGNSANRSEKRIRQAMVERGVVKAVLALPDRLFSHTSVPVSVWFLVHPSQACDEIAFIDGRQVGTPVRGKRALQDDDVQALLDAYRGCLHPGDNEHNPAVPTAVVAKESIRERDWSLSPVDHIDTHKPCRSTSEAAHREALTILELRTQQAWDADATAAWALEQVEQQGALLDAVGWECVSLSDLCTIQAGPSYSLLKKHITTDGGVRLLYPQNLREGRLAELSDDRHVTEARARSLERFLLRPEDIVCVRTGAMGPPALVRDVGAGWLMSANVIRLRMDDEHRARVHPGYLAAYLGRPESVAWVRDRATATGAPSISAAALGNQPVLLPPYPEQQRVVAILDALAAQARAHIHLAEAVTHTRAAVAERLMTSDLDAATRLAGGGNS